MRDGEKWGFCSDRHGWGKVKPCGSHKLHGHLVAYELACGDLSKWQENPEEAKGGWLEDIKTFVSRIICGRAGFDFCVLGCFEPAEPNPLEDIKNILNITLLLALNFVLFLPRLPLWYLWSVWCGCLHENYESYENYYGLCLKCGRKWNYSPTVAGEL